MKKKVFLLADDDIDDREMFCEALENIDSDITCYAVADGREALNALSSMNAQPQLIFLDINMPVMNGWQCLEKLKENEKYREIPVIVISTSSHQQEMNIAKKLGAFCYFIKPNHFNDLAYVLQTIVTNSGPSLPLAFQNIDGRYAQYVHLLTTQK